MKINKNVCGKIIVVIAGCLFISCGNKLNENSNRKTNTQSANPAINKKDCTSDSNSLLNKKDSIVIFKSLKEVVANKKHSVWVKVYPHYQSGTLHFCSPTPDTMFIGFSLECLAIFPVKIVDDKIIVYWDTNLEYKYDWDIVKTIKQIDKSYKGKPFMILKLENDTTLSATYPDVELKNRLNEAWIITWAKSCKGCTFPIFADKFYAQDSIRF